jgi:ketosteroid isomerase-like protein
MTNTQLITEFYTAFSQHDYARMAACYHDEVEFTDPAFGSLKGEQAKAMWKMLLERSGGKLKIVFSKIEANEKGGRAHWEAFYEFSKTGRPVHNKIDAQFEFKDGKIIKHIDHFNLWRWSQQALGLSGWLLGSTTFFKNKLQLQTSKALKDYMSQKKST